MSRIKPVAPLLLGAFLALMAVAVVVALAASAGAAQGGGAAGLLSTGFTYQGTLDDSGMAVDDTCDFQFSLWDAAIAGSQIGATDTVPSVAVVAGRFTAIVNDGNQFGAMAFNGADRWLAIAVRCPAGAGPYTPLSPRQKLTGAPYAQTAVRAGSAPWSGLIGVPAGFADGTDDDTTYTAGNGLMLDGTEFNAEGSPYANVVVVALSGGDFTGLQAALDSISDAAADNPYLVWVAPGVYTGTVTMKAFVDIVGAGEATTTLTSSGASVATLTGADDAGLRHLTVAHTGGSSTVVAIQNNGTSPRLSHVTARASDGSSATYAIYNLSGANPVMEHVTATASGTATAKGVVNFGGSSPRMTHMTITASGCVTAVCYGVDSRDGATPLMHHVTVSATGGGVAGVVAVFANNDSSLTLEDVTATAVNGTSSNTALSLISASAVVRHSVLFGDDSGGGTGRGFSGSATTGAYTITVNHSEINGPTNSLQGASAYTIQVGSSVLNGGPALDGGGSLVCAGVIDESYTFFASTCP